MNEQKIFNFETRQTHSQMQTHIPHSIATRNKNFVGRIYAPKQMKRSKFKLATCCATFDQIQCTVVNGSRYIFIYSVLLSFLLHTGSRTFNSRMIAEVFFSFFFIRRLFLSKNDLLRFIYF